MHDLQLSGESWHGDGEEYSVEALGQIVLECSRCGEYVILLGPEEDWPRSTGTPSTAVDAPRQSPSPTSWPQ
jgi:hypothetical protein